MPPMGSSIVTNTSVPHSSTWSRLRLPSNCLQSLPIAGGLRSRKSEPVEALRKVAKRNSQGLWLLRRYRLRRGRQRRWRVHVLAVPFVRPQGCTQATRISSYDAVIRSAVYLAPTFGDSRLPSLSRGTRLGVVSSWSRSAVEALSMMKRNRACRSLPIS